MPQPFEPMQCPRCNAAIDHVEVLARHVETCGAPFLPSDVVLSCPPLVDTMGRFEWEYAAALLVLANQQCGNAWQFATAVQIAGAARTELDRPGPLRSWLYSLVTNPFFNPDFDTLVERGFAIEAPGHGMPIALTAQGIARLYPWVKKKKTPPATEKTESAT